MIWDAIIKKAIAENDIGTLEALEQRLLKVASVAPDPFSPALAFTPQAEAELAASDDPDALASVHGAGWRFAIAVGNSISRAKRQVAFSLKVAGGFEGLTIISEGDSWFQYPVFLEDIVDVLSKDDDKAILSFGAAGDLIENIAANMEFLPVIKSLQPDVFLLSGGGNDCFGRGRLDAVLRPYSDGDQPADVIDTAALATLIGGIKQHYRRVVDAVIAAKPDIRVFGHGYDVPLPVSDGSWIGPVLDARGIPHDVGKGAVKIILDQFTAFLIDLDRDIPGYTFVNLRGLVGDTTASWENEIHPKNAGFSRLANAFREAIGMSPAMVATGAYPSSAATFSSLDSALADPQPETAMPDGGLRRRMAAEILRYEARRNAQSGHLEVHQLDPRDGGGRFEVAGINERYHPDEAQYLADLIHAGRHQDAEDYAVEFIANYTDQADRWTSVPAVAFYLRDCIFNRGPGGAAWIVQQAVGVTTDRLVGPITRAAIARAAIPPDQLLQRLRAARETYERRSRNESSIFWQGLVNRWDKALTFAQTLVIALDGAEVAAVSVDPFGPPSINRVLNCEPSLDTENDWHMDTAEAASLIQSAPTPPSYDLRADWWRVADQGATGSCVGWAAVDSVFRWHFVQAGLLARDTPLSARFVWMASKEMDAITSRPTTFIEEAGTTLKAALRVARKYGNVRATALPFATNAMVTGSEYVFYAKASQLRINSFHNLEKNQESWRRWIYQSGPILTRLNVDHAFQTAADTAGRLNHYSNDDGPQGGHAIALVGFTPEGFIVRNSWGTGWGDGGFAYASNAYAGAAFTECYGVTI